MSVRQALRAATRDEHDRVDALFSRFDLSRRAGYRAFLTAQHAAFAPVERAVDRAGGAAVLADWPARRRSHLLEADLTDLGAAAGEDGEPLTMLTPAEILGAVYVLEGSRLGGAVLRRRLDPAWPARFLNAPAEPGSWQGLIATLETALARPADLAAAIRAARTVFGGFETAGRKHLECVERA